MIPLVARAFCGFLPAILAGPVIAHGGHAVPPGVAPHTHLHLYDGIVVAPEWLLALAIAAVAAVVVARRARRTGAARVRDHARRR